MFAFRQRNDELFDERSHVLVGDNLALPLFYTQYRLINLDAHITLHFHLATQTPMILHLFAAEMRNFRRQNLATAIQYLAFALSARTLTTTSGRKEYTVHRQRIQQRGTGSYVQYIIAVDSQFYIT